MILTLALLGAGGAAFYAQPYLRGWTEPPGDAKAAGALALDNARSAGAQRWAPLPLEKAEGAMRSAIREEARQGARLLPRRDFRRTLRLFIEAERLALDAHQAALGELDRARVEAMAALRLAQQTLDDAENVELLMPLMKGERELLSRARINLLESKELFEGHEYERSVQCAGLCTRDARAMVDSAVPRAHRFTGKKQIDTWLAWIEQTIAWSKTNQKAAIIVYKEKNLVALYDKGRLVETFKGDMGMNTASAKLRAGDRATPEGKYRVKAKKGLGQSEYYKALLIDYPNKEDTERFQAALRAGLIPKGSKLGQFIEIHGEGGRDQDWTRGCIALANEDMDSLYVFVEVGTPITIVGGDGQDGVFSNFSRYYRERSSGTAQ